jgi:eukaryotic-like serine/threonine-protein kinase
VTFHQFRDIGGVRVPDEGRAVGSTPFAMAHLRPGAYLLVLRDAMDRETRLSVNLDRGERLSLNLEVPAKPPPDLIYVPRGPFVVGQSGPGGVQGQALPEGRCDLQGFLIARTPVTLGDYAEFLNHLHPRDPDAAQRRAPRAFDGASPFWTPDARGYTLPLPLRGGLEWGPDHPVVGITGEDVLAYIAWRRERDGVPYRLPTELEWEKAARGTDGRLYPWGDRPEPTFCQHLGSEGVGAALRPVGAVPQDVSVYGVQDMAGTVREYTDSHMGAYRVLRGGCFLFPFSECALTHRTPLTPTAPLTANGFRLATDGPRVSAVPPVISRPRSWVVPEAPELFRPSQVSAAGFLSEELTVEGRTLLLGQAHGRGVPKQAQVASEGPFDTGPDRYVVLEEIARGSMGRVVLAYDQVLQRHVALKLLHDKHRDDKLARYRFAMEARITGRLQHPTMVPIYDFGLMRNGARFFAMKVVEGMSLQDVLRARVGGDRRAVAEYGRDRLLTVMRRVCQGVAFAHESHVVHRDLKPANILIGEQGEVVIVDLGLARQLKPDASDRKDVEEANELAGDTGRITRVGSVIGTPYYMSPEQAMGLQDLVGPQADVYGLGAILYHVLAGRPPYSGKKVAEVLAKVRRGNPRPPSKAAPDQDISSELDRTVLKALAMDPRERHEDPRRLAGELLAWQEGARVAEKDREVARQRVTRSEEAFAAYDGELHRLDELRLRLHALRSEVEHSEPVERRRLLWQAGRKVEAQERELEARIAEAVRQARLALDESHPHLRTRLCVVLQTRYVRAEKSREVGALAYYGRLLEQIDVDGSLQRWRDRGAPVSLHTMPVGLTAAIHRFVERDRSLRPSELVARGSTPIDVADCPVGSGVASVTHGGTTLRIPFGVDRDRPVELQLPWPAEVRAGFAVVSGGRFLYGGDPHDDEGHTARAAKLPTFQMAVHPVTCIEYLAWLDTQEPKRRAARSPRMGPAGAPLWGPEGQRRFGGFSPHRPVTGISLADAHAYTQWRSRRDGVKYRLPTSAEWEKSARGVDGRAWPWGHHFEPAYCRGDHYGLTDVGSFPEDISPYGVQDLVTGVLEWTLTAARNNPDACYVRGGCSALPLHHQPCTARVARDPKAPSPFIGFRLVMA